MAAGPACRAASHRGRCARARSRSSFAASGSAPSAARPARAAARRRLRLGLAHIPALLASGGKREARPQARKRRVRLGVEGVDRKVGAVEQPVLGTEGDRAREGRSKTRASTKRRECVSETVWWAGSRSPRP